MAELTKRQEAYVKAVESGLKGCEFPSTGLCPGCPQCADDYGMTTEEFTEAYEAGTVEGESSFSWSPCAVCGSPLGGDRNPLHYWWTAEDGTENLAHDDGACVDCIMFLANGDIPDDEYLSWLD